METNRSGRSCSSTPARRICLTAINTIAILLVLACSSTDQSQELGSTPASSTGSSSQPLPTSDVFGAATGYKAPSGPKGSQGNPVKEGETLSIQYTSKGFSKQSVYASDGARLVIFNRIQGSSNAPTSRFCRDRSDYSICNPSKAHLWRSVTYGKTHTITVNQKSSNAEEFIVRARPYEGLNPLHSLKVHIPQKQTNVSTGSSILVPVTKTAIPVAKLPPTPIVIVVKESIGVGSSGGSGEKGTLVLDPLIERIKVVDESATTQSGGTIVLEPLLEVILVEDRGSTTESAGTLVLEPLLETILVSDNSSTTESGGTLILEPLLETILVVESSVAD